MELDALERARRGASRRDGYSLREPERFIRNTQNEKGPPMGTLCHLARPERFELPTARFVAEYSIQLSYGRIV